SEVQQRLYDSVRESSAEISTLREAITTYVDYTDQRATEVTQAAQANAASGTVISIAVAAVGVAFGIALGLFISQFGITRPFRSIVACLRRLADGDLDVEVVGAGRRDEIGTLAET